MARDLKGVLLLLGDWGAVKVERSLSEAALVYRVETWLQQQGYETRLELQWRPLATTDLVGARGDEYVGIEVKVRNWKRALGQAVRQGKAFDKVYIAAKYSPNSRQLAEVLEDSCPWTNWVGVLAVNGASVEVLREPRSVPAWPKAFHKEIVALQFELSYGGAKTPFVPPRRSIVAPS